MKVEFIDRFNKYLEKIKDQELRNSIAAVIKSLEEAEKLSEINNLRKLTGFKNDYRIRVGNYRTGIHFENNTLSLVRFAHRKDIYKIFPEIIF